MSKCMSKELLTAAVGAALAVAGPAAFAVEAKISGQVNKAIMYADDGGATETHYVDNDISSSRFRFTGSEELGGGLTAGITWEVEMQSNDSNLVTQANRVSTTPLTERIQEVYFSSAFGKLGLGQGPGAADGGAEVDLSGTDSVIGALSYLLGAGIAFRVNGAPGATGTGPTIGQVIADQDFESRYDRLRYDSPKLGPATISASRGVGTGGTDINEVAARISTDLGGAGKLAATVGYSDEDKNSPADNETTVGGSVSWLAAFGLNVTLGYTNVEDDTPGAAKDAKWTLVKVGYKLGDHAVAVMGVLGDDQAASGDEAESAAVAYVYTPSKAVEIYAGVQTYSLDRPGTDFEDITIGTLGSRIKF